MSPSMHRHLATLALVTALGSVAHAQTILRGKDLSEQNLIEALQPAATPPAATNEEPDDGVKLRSIRVQRDQPSAKALDQVAKAAPPKKTSASVLITFVTNSADLTDRAKASLDIVGRALQADRLANFKFAIEGHADPRGNAEDNLRLSQGRADSVVRYLAEQHRISPDRLKPIGKGDTELFNARQADAPENRRVTIVTLRE